MEMHTYTMQLWMHEKEFIAQMKKWEWNAQIVQMLRRAAVWTSCQHWLSLERHEMFSAPDKFVQVQRSWSSMFVQPVW